MIGLNGFKGKNAADKSLILMGTTLLRDGIVNALAIYSRDTGFGLAFPFWKLMFSGTKIIVPKLGNEFIQDADIYINTERDNKNPKMRPNLASGKEIPLSELGAKIKEKYPDIINH